MTALAGVLSVTNDKRSAEPTELVISGLVMWVLPFAQSPRWIMASLRLCRLQGAIGRPRLDVLVSDGQAGVAHWV